MQGLEIGNQKLNWEQKFGANSGWQPSRACKHDPQDTQESWGKKWMTQIT